MQEEQRVIEAKIRMRQQELQDDEERMQKRQELDAVSRNTETVDAEYNSANGTFSLGLWFLCVYDKCYILSEVVNSCFLFLFLFGSSIFYLSR